MKEDKKEDKENFMFNKNESKIWSDKHNLIDSSQIIKESFISEVGSIEPSLCLEQD